MFRVLLALIVAGAFVVGKTPTVLPTAHVGASEVHQVSAPTRDIYGNQVDRAVGGYRVDVRGELYEEHNPDTAVLELGPPSS
jgi:hypothetical protein